MTSAVKGGMSSHRLATPVVMTATLLLGGATALASPLATAAAQDRHVSFAYTEKDTDDTIHALDPSIRVDLENGRRSRVDIGGTVSGGGQQDNGQCAAVCSSSAIDVHARVPVTTRFALVSRLWGRSVMDELDSITYSMGSQNVRYSIRPGLWVETGVGLTRIMIDRDEELDVAVGEVSPALAAAAGVDLTTVRGVDLDLELRGGGGFIAETNPVYTADMMLGARW
jgi:hypothetical protein